MAAATAVAVLLLGWALAPRPVAVEAAAAAAGRFERSIDEDGKTRVTDRYVLAAPLAGRVARSTLHEGDEVKAGDVVARITPVLSPLLDERSRSELGARAQAAEAGVARAEAGVERAKVAVEQARTELARSEQLSRQGFVSPTKLDTDRLALQAARKEQDAAVAARHVAEHELDTARAALLSVQAARSGGTAVPAAFELRSPVAGRVLRILQASEAPVALGTPLLELGDITQMEIVAELLTTDALQTPPGAPVRVEGWGGPQALAGTVRRVEPGGYTKVSALGVEEQRVKVVIALTSPAEQWRALGDGFRVAVKIVAQVQDQALMVPVSAVFPRTDGITGMAVFTVKDGRARLVPVELGGRNGSQAWIRNGLAAGDQVIVYPPATVADGVRVKLRKV
jgi:HlyD family secretion protein